MSHVCVLWILGFFGILIQLIFETKPEWQQAEPFPIANRTYNLEQRISFFHLSGRSRISKKWGVLNIGSIRIYILMTGVVSNETNEDVRMYILGNLF